MVRGIARERTRATAGVTGVTESANNGVGSTNTTAVITCLSGSWQHDIEQFIMPPIVWPQSSPAAEFVGAF